jgi:hypothetical protein
MSNGVSWVASAGGGAPVAGTGINVAGSTVSLDTSFALSRATGQAGTDTFLTGTSASGTTYVVSPVGNALASYQDGMRLGWRPDVTATGNNTLNVSTLGARCTYLGTSGTIRAGASDVIGGSNLLILYDASLPSCSGATGGWRIISGGGSSTSVTSPYLTIGSANFIPLGGFFAATLPPTSGWNTYNTGGETFTTSGLGGAINLTSNSTSGFRHRGRDIAGATTLTLAVAFSGLGNAGNYSGCGVSIHRPGGVGALMSLGSAATALPLVSAFSFNSSFSFTGSVGSAGTATPMHAIFRIQLTGGNVVMSFSQDAGLTYTTLYSATQTTVLGGSVASNDVWSFAVSGTTSNTASCTLLSWQVS